MHCRDGAHIVVGALAVPGNDPGVEHRVRQGEEQLHVLVQRVAVVLRHELPEKHPVARWQLRVRAVGPVLGDRFLEIGQPPAVVQDLLGLHAVAAEGVQVSHLRRAELGVRG